MGSYWDAIVPKTIDQGFAFGMVFPADDFITHCRADRAYQPEEKESCCTDKYPIAERILSEFGETVESFNHVGALHFRHDGFSLRNPDYLINFFSAPLRLCDFALRYCMPPLVIAHRGASGYEPENTLRAFELAIAQGAQMIEMDLHLTRDGHVVVIHGSDLSETTNLHGLVSNMTLADLRRADAGKGERVPTLDETLDLVRGRAELYLEIKDTRAAEETLRIVRARGLERGVMLASFDLDLMRRLGVEVKDIRLGLILGSRSLSPVVVSRMMLPWIVLRHFNYQVLSVHVKLCHHLLVRQTRSQGKGLFVWTVNDEGTMRRTIALGVDGIVTNYPDRLVKLMEYGGSTPFSSA